MDRGAAPTARLAKVCCRDGGFTLVEVLMATLVLACGVAAVAALAFVAARASTVARRNSVAATIARAKMEQLRALAWTSDGAVVPVSDWWSDLSRPPGAAGGSGLGVSPPGTIESNVDGYCDFADAEGRWVAAAGAAAPRSASWVRRWSIGLLPGAPGDTLRFEVVVLPVRGDRADSAPVSMRWVNGARLIDIRARRAR